MKGKVDVQILHALTTGDDWQVPFCDRYCIVELCHDLLYPQHPLAPQDPLYDGLKDLWVNTLNRAAELNLETCDVVLLRWIQQYRQRRQEQAALRRLDAGARTDPRFN